MEFGTANFTLANVKSTIRTYEAVNSIVRHEAKAGAVSRNSYCFRCGDKSHLRTNCNAPEDKLYCTHCKVSGTHNTKACTLKRKADKEKLKAQQAEKLEEESVDGVKKGKW